MADGVFITGTDTEVGKTYVSALAARWLKASGVDVGVMKPVETGCAESSGKLLARDAAALVEAAEIDDEMALVAPYRFSQPLAPLVAAQIERESIDPSEILKAFGRLSALHSFMLVEGAGGLLVPIAESYTMLDLAEELGLPVIVVAASRLGAINHSLLTLEAAKARGVQVAGLVLNNLSAEPDQAQRTNARVLSALVRVPVLEIAHGARWDDAASLGELVLSAANRRF